MPREGSNVAYQQIVDQLILDKANRDHTISRLSATHLAMSGGLRLGDTLNMNSLKIIGVATPTADADGARKVYVDDEIDTHIADLDAHTKHAFEILRTGEYFDTLMGTKTTAAMTANTLYGMPLLVARDITVDRIAIHVTSAAASGKKARLGIYNNGINLYPGTLLLDAGEVDVDGTGVKAITIDQALTKGIYFLVVVSDSTPTLAALSYQHGFAFPHIAYYSTTFEGKHMNWNLSHSYAALPDPYTAGGSKGSNGYHVCVRIASLD